MPETRTGAVAPVDVLCTSSSERQGSLDGCVTEIVDKNLRGFFESKGRSALSTDTRFATALAGALGEFTLAGGKRMRPRFAWWGWRAAGGPDRGAEAAAALRACAALELIQSCALVHDDVMDGSLRRRGRPTVHVAFSEAHRARGLAGDRRRYGESMAVLVGDLALVWADDMLDDALSGTPARIRVREPWQAMRTEIMAGQFLDIQSQAERDDSESTALRVDRLKTAAYSVERPLQFGAAMAGADPALVGALRAYGADVGIAFQLRDDLLGVYGEPETTGKPVGDDLREGKRTLLVSLGLRHARERADRRSEEAILSALGTPGLTAADVRVLAVLLEGLGARAAVEERITGLVERGTGHLAGSGLDARVREALHDMAAKAAVRDG